MVRKYVKKIGGRRYRHWTDDHLKHALQEVKEKKDPSLGQSLKSKFDRCFCHIRLMY